MDIGIFGGGIRPGGSDCSCIGWCGGWKGGGGGGGLFIVGSPMPDMKGGGGGLGW